MTNIIAKVEDLEKFLLDWFVKHFSHEVTQDKASTAGYARIHTAYADLRAGLIPPAPVVEAPVAVEPIAEIIAPAEPIATTSETPIETPVEPKVIAVESVVVDEKTEEILPTELVAEETSVSGEEQVVPVE